MQNPTLYAGTGCLITFRGRLPEPVTIPSCPHETRLGHRYCPDCGTRVDDVVHTHGSAAVAERYRTLIAPALPEGFHAVRIEDALLLLRGVASPCGERAATLVAPDDMDEVMVLIGVVLTHYGLQDEAVWGVYSAVAPGPDRPAETARAA